MLWFAQSTSADIAAYATELSQLLLPGTIDKFPRQRWLTSINSVRQVLLLRFLGLFDEAVPIWIAKLRSQTRKGGTCRGRGKGGKSGKGGSKGSGWSSGWGAGWGTGWAADSWADSSGSRWP